jgi:hypothetical protein
MVLNCQCAAEGEALGLQVLFKLCRVMARGGSHPAVVYSCRVQVQPLKMIILSSALKQCRKRLRHGCVSLVHEITIGLKICSSHYLAIEGYMEKPACWNPAMRNGQEVI